MIGELTGRRCTAIRRFHHQVEGQPASETGPIEFTWDDGTHLTLDANADWTLDLSGQRWCDPYAHASPSERAELAREVGVWAQRSTSADLDRLVGQVVLSALPDFNEVGELTALTVAFEGHSVSARVLGGEFVVKVHGR